MKTTKERKAILEIEVAKTQKHGWQVIDRTDTTCQLSCKKKANGCLGLFLCLIFLIPGIIYFVVANYTLYDLIEVDKKGKITHSYKPNQK